MKMLKFSILTLMFISMCFANVFSNSNDKFEFSVLMSKGKLNVKRANSDTYILIKPNDKLFYDDMIQIGEGSYLGLIHNTGSALELKKSGIYSVSKLVSQATTKKSNVSQKFKDFLIEEMITSAEVENPNFRKNMKTLGSVERSVNENEYHGNVFPKSSYYISNDVVLTWSNKKSSGVTLTIKNSENITILKKELTGTGILLNFNELNIAYDECFYWNIKINGKVSEDFCIFRINEKERNEIVKEIEAIENSYDEESALVELMKAFYFESKKLYTEANESYILAIQKEPTVEDFRESYNQFLNRIYN